MAAPRQPDPVRSLLRACMDERGDSMKALSEAMGYSHAYVQQFLTRHKPQRLHGKDRVFLAARYNRDPDDFRHPREPPMPSRRREATLDIRPLLIALRAARSAELVRIGDEAMPLVEALLARIARIFVLDPDVSDDAAQRAGDVLAAELRSAAENEVKGRP